MRSSLHTIAVSAFYVTALAAAACGGSADVAGSPDGGGADAASSRDDGGTDAASSRDDGGTDAASSQDSGGVCTGGGSIAFDLTVDSTDPVYFGGSQPPWPTSLGCPGWLTVTTAAGEPLVVSQGNCFVGCPAATPETAAPQSFTWNGTYYPVPTYCTGPTPACSCTTPACAPAGTYAATFCVGYAGPDAGTFTSAGPTCKQVTFTWPPSSAASSIDETIAPTPDGG
jgi:hypothetical protein